MERYFLEHHVQRDRDPDEMKKREEDSEEDSEASEGEDIEAARQTHSVHDASSPWTQTPVQSDWGQIRKSGGARSREFRSQHTGPKGVIRDYHAHKKYQRQERERKELERQAALLRIAKGATTTETANSDDELDDLLLDEEFLHKYNAMRVGQMQEAAQSHNGPPRTLQFISPEQFVEMTDAAKDKEILVVHLYDPASYPCGLLNQHMQQLAPEMANVTLAAMIAGEADKSIRMQDLPVILIYCGTQLQETIVTVSKDLDGEYTFERVKQFIQEHVQF